MTRLGALLALTVLGSACDSQTWNFSDDSGAAAQETTDTSVGASDATVGEDASGIGPGSRDTGIPEAGPSDDVASREAGTLHCSTDTQCLPIGLHCLLPTGECVPCTSSSQCLDPARPRCDPALNRCVECDMSSDCRPNEVCIVDPVHSCIPSCISQACPFRAGYCDPIRSICLECRGVDGGECPMGQTCDPLIGRCVGCTSDYDCRNRLLPHCDPILGRCVECVRNADCFRGFCSAFGTCIAFDSVRVWWDE